MAQRLWLSCISGTQARIIFSHTMQSKLDFVFLWLPAANLCLCLLNDFRSKILLSALTLKLDNKARVTFYCC